MEHHANLIFARLFVSGEQNRTEGRTEEERRQRQTRYVRGGGGYMRKCAKIALLLVVLRK